MQRDLGYADLVVGVDYLVPSVPRETGLAQADERYGWGLVGVRWGIRVAVHAVGDVGYGVHDRRPHRIEGDVLGGHGGELVVHAVQLPLDEVVVLLGRGARCGHLGAVILRDRVDRGSIVAVEGYGVLVDGELGVHGDVAVRVLNHLC